jgi:hypothetical protein
MDSFKKFVAEGRNRFSSTTIWHDGDDNDEDIFCYHQQNDDSATGRGSCQLNRHTNDDCQKITLSPSGSFGVQRVPPASVITSSEFDSDERFLKVANSILRSFEEENLSKRDAIQATLCTTDKQRSFLESMDRRYTATSYNDGFDNPTGTITNDVTEILSRIRSNFYSTLYTMWKEANDKNNNTINSYRNENQGSSSSDIHDRNEEELLRTGPPSSVTHYKNISSPIECTPRATAMCRSTQDSYHQERTLHEPQSRKRTKCFFDDSSERVRKSLSELAKMSSVGCDVNKNQMFPALDLNIRPSRFHFDFTLPLPSTGAKRVESLQLDYDDTGDHHFEFASSSSLGRTTTMYRPPTSPISGEFSIGRSIKF